MAECRPASDRGDSGAEKTAAARGRGTDRGRGFTDWSGAMSEEKVDLNDYLTRKEVQQLLGCSPRAFWRAVERAGKDKVCVLVLGRTLVPKSAVETIRQNYYPRGSESSSEMAKVWGASGGNAKAANARSAKRKEAGR